MAILYRKRELNNLYEVRSAGNSVRLYTNGVFHSQWNAKRPLAGHLWDLLFLPSLLLDKTTVGEDAGWSADDEKHHANRRALMLGVGGGTIINLLNYYKIFNDIIGVDLDRQHLWLAKRFFLSNAHIAKLIHQSAQEFVATSDASTYRYIVEDIFAENDEGEAARAVAMDENWLFALARVLTPDGILVCNFESQRQLRRELRPDLMREAGFESLLVLSMSRYENAIAVCSKRSFSKADFRARINAFVNERPKAEVRDLNYELSEVRLPGGPNKNIHSLELK